MCREVKEECKEVRRSSRCEKWIEGRGSKKVGKEGKERSKEV